MHNPVVSIITPCYNAAKFLNVFLNSLSNQSYKNIEYIFVNDGSNDSSEEIFKNWKKKHENDFISIRYLYQNNQGQACAVHNGLKYVTGKYFMCCDADDILEQDNINEKVIVLESNPKIDLVFCACNEVEADTGKIINEYHRKRTNDHFFEDVILEKGIHYCPANYMLRMSTFDKYCLNRDIYINRGGQNWQLLLPVSYNQNVYYIDKILTKYMVSQNSHSKKLKSLNEIYSRLDMHKDILINTINSIDMNDLKRDYYNNLIDKKYIQLKFNYAIKYHNNKCIKQYLKQNINIKKYIIYFMYKMRILDFILKVRS